MSWQPDSRVSFSIFAASIKHAPVYGGGSRQRIELRYRAIRSITENSCTSVAIRREHNGANIRFEATIQSTRFENLVPVAVIGSTVSADDCNTRQFVTDFLDLIEREGFKVQDQKLCAILPYLLTCLVIAYSCAYKSKMLTERVREELGGSLIFVDNDSA